MIIRIVYRMIRPAAVLAAKTAIQRGDAQMLQERRVVRSRPERADAQVSAVHRLGPGSRRAVNDLVCTRAFPDGEACLRIAYIAPDFVNKLLQRVRARHAEES